VPVPPLGEVWTDAKLYAHYGFTIEEIAFVKDLVAAQETDLFDNLADD